MKRTLFTGSFSLPTFGHLDIIERASTLCETLIVGIAQNSRKDLQFFNSDEKKDMLVKMTQDLDNVDIEIIECLSVDFALKNKIECLIRGLRSTSDFEHEYQLALSNRQLSGIETIFLISDPKFSHISSSLIHEIAGSGKRLRGFVPDEIEEFVFKRLCQNESKS